MSDAEQPPLITECPNCHTRFRVSDSQLQIAHGRVRCGACLAVFPGMDHMLLDEESDVPSADRRQRRNSTLESVLSELSEEQARDYPDEQPNRPVGGDGHADEDDKVAAELLNGYDPAFVKRDSRFEFVPDKENDATNDTETSASSSHSRDDWMAVSVDTTAMKVVSTDTAEQDVPPQDANYDDGDDRPSLDDALNDEEALRWWLADELTGEHAQAASDISEQEQLDPAPAETEESFDLEELILAAADGSAEKLEALLSELPSEMPQPKKEELAVPELESAALAAGGDGLEAAPPRLSIEVAANTGNPMAAGDRTAAEIDYDDVPIVGPVPNIPERIMAAIAKRKRKATESADDERATTTEQLLADGALATAEFDALDQVARAEALSHAGRDESPNLAAAPSSSTAAGSTAAESAPQPMNLPSVVGSTGSVVPLAQEPGTAAGSTWFGALLASGRTVRIGTAVASLLLVVQIFYHQFDSWVEQPNLRPVYGAACSVLGCELPALRSITELSSRKLVVRQHPDAAELLLVDVLLVNEAEFAQPFPLLELNFMNARGEIAVTHKVAADEYLGGELRGSGALMPTRTPVHIDFEVPNPGADAGSYQLAIR